ncbi:hypothetical protein RJ640_027844 [Escallonia rubra]|uniref:Uncharacterized protein n=1 Tax=Escallonia rubra TaxID=112253 RepID=A0AA88RLA7_9ASTE|nr:hypothetical protein RJ640_027844 [Escallonia rubra]
MANSSKTSIRHHIRSISLPSRSHPSTLRIEEELNKLKTREALSDSTAEMICTGLSGMEELHKCMGDLLSLPLTQQALSVHQQEVSTKELLDESLRLLDICGITRDAMSQIKEHVRDLQSSLRRKKGELSIESSIVKFTSFRKKMKKDARRSIAVLKSMGYEMESSPVLDLDHHLGAVIRVLRAVSAVSISIFQSLLLFLSVPVLKKSPSRWSVISKLMSKGAACENQLDSMNELERVDAALCSLWKYGSFNEDKMKTAQSRLEVLEARIEGIENGNTTKMSSSSHTKRRHHTRSINLPSGSHPSTARTKQELNKLKTWETSTTQTAETICNGLSGMEEMYKCMDGLLSLPLTQQALSHLKEYVRNIQSSLRRRKGESSTGSSIVRFTSFRKKMKKDTKRLIAALKQTDNQSEVTKILDLDGHSVTVIKGTVCENQRDSMNELERLDGALCATCRCTSSEEEKMQIAQSRLDGPEGCIEGFENGLEKDETQIVANGAYDVFLFTRRVPGPGATREQARSHQFHLLYFESGNELEGWLGGI